ncbi:MAG: hypothetical protein R2862_11985 [Thermoanaerobaculia bacterium]
MNFALDRAIEPASGLGAAGTSKLRCDYRWASRRLHRFVLDGMAENARRAAGAALLYVPPSSPGAARGKVSCSRSRGAPRRSSATTSPASSCRGWWRPPPARSTAGSKRSTPTASCRSR